MELDSIDPGGCRRVDGGRERRVGETGTEEVRHERKEDARQSVRRRDDARQGKKKEERVRRSKKKGE